MKPTILVTEDDASLLILLSLQLKKQFNVLNAENGKQAIQILLKNKVDLMVTDIIMPGMNGYQLVQSLRENGSEIPIIMLTANQSIEAKKRGFHAGTDDFLTKPFNKEELIWRIQALLRRVKINTDQKITYGNITANLSNFTFSKGSREYNLSKKEFELLWKLLSNPGRIFTKNQLLEDIWGYYSESSEDTIKTHVSRLRQKINDIDELSIITIKGIGYKAEVNEK